MTTKTVKAKAPKKPKLLVKKVKKEVPHKAQYHLSINIGGLNYDYDTDDLIGTLMNFPDTRLVKSKVVFHVSSGKLNFERTVWPILARRYFVSKSFAQGFTRDVNRFLR